MVLQLPEDEAKHTNVPGKHYNGDQLPADKSEFWTYSGLDRSVFEKAGHSENPLLTLDSPEIDSFHFNFIFLNCEITFTKKMLIKIRDSETPCILLRYVLCFFDINTITKISV